MEITYHPAVGEDVVKAVEWYESHRAGSLIRRQGASFAVSQDDIRVVQLRRFPYGVYYRVKGDIARVLTVKHLRSRPDRGLSRR